MTVNPISPIWVTSVQTKIQNMATLRMFRVALAIAAVCLIGQEKFVSCDDPDGLTDFCVGVLPHNMRVWETGTEVGEWGGEGYDPSKMGAYNASAANFTSSGFLPCKDLAKVDAQDFTFCGLKNAPKVSNALGSVVTPASVNQFPALNTLEISAARIDFVKGGVNSPHVHPRASELLYVIEGTIDVGFVDTTNKLFEKTLEAGDLFVFPRGLVHFQVESGKGTALAIAFLSSQNPGVSQIATNLLDSDPKIAGDVLEKSFGIDQKVVTSLFHGVGALSGSVYP
ncbi:hypothetical protein Mapa_008357 [Marchantia paleacea]|nr:hypothetical protein Mapa_008357 [Marchantia paleacea]